MGIEIERKFRVAGDGWRAGVRAIHRIEQGYLAATDSVAIRIRIVDDRTAILGIKSAGADARSRGEFEYDVPLEEARQLMQLAGNRTLAKRRHELEVAGKDWVVDIFEGKLDGLALAEIELEDADEPFEHPAWLGEEVTGNPQFSNSELAAARN
jgi:adenylate cyclase